MSEAINGTIGLITPVLETIEKHIEEAIAHDKAVPSVKLATEICGNFGLDKMQVYHLINIYVKGRKDLHIRKGPGGGVCKKPLEV